MDQPDLVKDYLTKIGTSSQHLLSLINDVLDMSRIESGVVKIEEKEVCIPDIIHDLKTIIQGNIQAKQQDLYIDTQDVVHENVITDRLRLNQILLNIVSNAIKFTPVGGLAIFAYPRNHVTERDLLPLNSESGIMESECLKNFRHMCLIPFQENGHLPKVELKGQDLVWLLPGISLI